MKIALIFLLLLQFNPTSHVRILSMIYPMSVMQSAQEVLVSWYASQVFDLLVLYALYAIALIHVEGSMLIKLLLWYLLYITSAQSYGPKSGYSIHIKY